MSQDESKVQKRRTSKPTEELEQPEIESTPPRPTETVETLKRKIQDCLNTAPLFDANAPAKDITAFTEKYESFLMALQQATK